MSYPLKEGLSEENMSVQSDLDTVCFRCSFYKEKFRYLQ